MTDFAALLLCAGSTYACSDQAAWKTVLFSPYFFTTLGLSLVSFDSAACLPSARLLLGLIPFDPNLISGLSANDAQS